MTSLPSWDVIIAGAGPVGLYLACELRLSKLSVLVLEAAESPEHPLKRLPFGMRGLWGPSIEAFYRRGLLEEVAADPPSAEGAGAPSPPRPRSRRSDPSQRGPAGHFGGIQFDYANIDASRWSYQLAGPSDIQLGVDMEHIERVLVARALDLGVDIRRGHGVTGVDIAEDAVSVQAGPEGARYRGLFLVGCDGGRSSIRKLAQFEFTGTEPEFTGYSVIVDLADASLLRSGRQTTPSGMYTQWQPGVIGMADFDGGAFHRTSPITPAHVQDVLRRVSGTDVIVDAVKLAATWTDRAFQTTTYRKGRVLLAGDAAHVHSPLGGQGLNLGLGDAMNLGWKLAATVRGSAPEGLLDSYTEERHPVGARILDWSRAQVALMRPSRQSRALEAVVRDLLATKDGATYMAERLWGVSLRYDLGGAHPLVGRSCPDFAWPDGTRMGALLHDGKGLLLDFDGNLRALEGHWGDKVTYVGQPAVECLGLRAVLVRPDGFVAWASDDSASPADVEKPAARWFAASRA